jgi:hypothetical protein
MNQTLQDRLVKELRLRDIASRVSIARLRTTGGLGISAGVS